MDHIAIMKKSWGLIDKILLGEKTIESRWYKNKSIPWGKIKIGDNIYFKNSGGPVYVRAKITKVLEFESLDEGKRKEILDKYGKADLGTKEIMPEIRQHVEGKNYCLLIFFNDVKEIKPFDIDKKGFGAMAAWIAVDKVDKIIK